MDEEDQPIDGQHYLTTAEILYHAPDQPHRLCSFVWQDFDRAPDYPELQRFLTFWLDHMQSELHSVRICALDQPEPGGRIYAPRSLAIH